jgi:Lrp/AsnC family transcriptional regulator, leucine-responsive regulatory protein
VTFDTWESKLQSFKVLVRFVRKRPSIDAIDGKIIQRLVADGRVSFAALGRLVNLSTPAVHHRVRRLEAEGVITGYGARVDPGAIGLGLSGIVAVETEGSLGSIVAAVRAMPEVEACWSTAGTSDLLLKVRAGDPPAMERLLVRLRELVGVDRTRTTILLDTHFEREPDPAAIGVLPG